MKQKILLIAPCLAMGGMERAAANTAEGISSSGVSVVFLSLFKKEHFFKLSGHIKIVEPNGFNVGALSMIKSVLWIRSVVQSEKPDRVLAFNKFYAALTALALIGIKVPLYISERSSPLFVWRQPFKLINSIAFWLRSPQGVLAQTSTAADYQRKYFRKSEVQVIPNIVRPIQLYPEVKREKVILAVGRLGDHLKGFDLLIESFSKLSNKDWQLHIAGGDENGQELKDLASSLGVLDRVRFLGKVTDIDRVFAYAGIFVIPSRSEGFPNALAEAMAAGCCCVAFDFVAGPRDIIVDGVSGIIVDNGNIQKLAETLDELIRNPQKRQLLEAQAIKIDDQLNGQKISNKIVEFLKIKNGK